MHLVAGSDLIDAGVNIGSPYTGVAPDLGAFEIQTGSGSAIPVYSSSAIQNATPSLLEMTYNMTLANIVPAVSSLSVLVNSIARTVTTVAVTSNKVQLTLVSPVKSGDIITVAYTKPATNPLQSTSGGQAASISASSVRNNCIAIILVYSASSVENATPALIGMTYSTSLANIVPAVSAFNVLVNSAVSTVSSVLISGSMVQLTIASPIKYGDIVTVSYTKPSSNPLQTTNGGQAISISAQPVVNNLINPTKDATAVTINMTVHPNHVHRITNVALQYSSSPTVAGAVASPEIIRIFDLSGKLFIEKVLDIGTTNIRIPLNLRSGIYTINVLAGGVVMDSQRMMVY